MTLTPKQRQVVTLVGKGWSFARIAQKLKISGAAVHYRATYAAKKLKGMENYPLWDRLYYHATMEAR